MAERRAKVQDVVATVVPEERTRRAAATTPEARENQLIAAAYDRAEQQILDGTASAQVITHFLKLGSSREAIEKRKIEMETSLLEIKREAIESQKRVEELYAEAMSAFRSYSGDPTPVGVGSDVDEEFFDD